MYSLIGTGGIPCNRTPTAFIARLSNPQHITRHPAPPKKQPLARKRGSPYSTREQFDADAARASEIYARGVRARAKAIKISPDKPYETPSRTACDRALADPRWNGKMHGKPDTRSRYGLAKEHKEDRVCEAIDAHRGAYAAKDYRASTLARQQFRRLSQADYLVLAAKHWSDQPDKIAALSYGTNGIGYERHATGMPRCLLANDEHAGNGCVVFGKRKQKALTSKKAKRRGKENDKKARRRAQPKRQELSAEEWYCLAINAQAGSEVARNKIFVEAGSIAERLEVKKNDTRFGPGELVMAGLDGHVSKKTGKASSGVEFAIREFDPRKGRGFKSFLTTAIDWGMRARQRTHRPVISLDTPIGAEADGTLVDVITEYDAHTERGFDWDQLRAKLDEWVDAAGLTRNEQHALSGYHLCRVKRTWEQVGDEMGVSRETARKYADAALKKINAIAEQIGTQG